MRIGYKILVVVALLVTVLIPISLIRGTVQDRQRHQFEAVQEVSLSTAGAQRIVGPVLVVPYTDRTTVTRVDRDGVRREEERVERGEWVYFPRALDVHGTLRPTPRRRGLYEVRLYEFDARVQASFTATLPRPDDPAVKRSVGVPRLGLGLGDVRGLVGVPKLEVDGRAIALRQGFGYRDGRGVHATLGTPVAGSTLTLDSRFTLTLQGTESLSVVPIAGSTVVEIASAWPHPQFNGEFLPRTRTIGPDGFRARWEIASLATDAQAQFLDPKAGDAGNALDAIGVSLVDPVNVYTQVDRATKYALLFVLLTFVAFFMFEFLKALRIHPIQYGLVGLAIAIFFLLLLALSEHVAFALAYVVAAVACVALIGHYLAHVLGGWKRGVGFSAMLATLYAALYGLLISEDNAMVLGAGLLFVVLATIMVLTRKVDWYRDVG